MAGFNVNGKTYELATDFTIDEWCKAVDAFDSDLDTEPKRIRALIWISMLRAGDDIPAADVGNITLGGLFAESDASPPPLELAEPSVTSGPPSNDSGSTDSLSDIGSPGLDTGSDSGRETFFTLMRAS